MSHDHHAMMGMATTTEGTSHAIHEMDHSMHSMNHSGGDMDHSGMDHGGMDHGGMDHGGMDHGGMDKNGTGGMDHGGMKMYFHAGCSATILFEGWKVNSIGGLLGSMIGIFIMAALYEGLKYYREYLFRKTYQGIEYSSVAVPNDKGVVVSDGPKVVPKASGCQHGSDCGQCPSAIDMCQYMNDSSRVPYSYLFGFHVTHMFSCIHLYQTFLHVVQVVLSYFLMLIFMTYNVWLCLAVALGAAFGYFVFGWKKSVVVDITEHCH